MRLHFWGASQTVTGSRYLLSEGGEKILIDCGLFQGFKDLRLKNWEHLPVDVSEITAVILTHAHLDHSGYLPLLIKNGFKGRVYATPATRELSRILLLDSGYLQEEEAKFANRRGYSKHHPALPLYTRKDAELAMRNFVDVAFNKKTKISDRFSFEFFPAGHLLGAASVRVSASSKSILFSGDLGRECDPIMKPPQAPMASDFLVVESTYGDRLHPQTDPMEELKQIVEKAINRGGTVIIPSFAVGRAQLLLHFLRELLMRGSIPDVPVYLNSPMANSVNGVFRKYAGEHRLDKLQAVQVCQIAQVVSTPEASKDLNEDEEPKVIIAASGMATGGRVLHHLKKLAPDPRNAIVFAGFQAGGTRGEAMVNGAKEIKIHGEYWPIRAEVYNLESLSAHADAVEILSWVRKMNPLPSRVFVTHGELSSAEALAGRIRAELNIPTEVPEMMSEVEL
ncbi:MAG: MBL fold metallo-hydrolase [Bdellovibrionales bacterium]